MQWPNWKNLYGVPEYFEELCVNIANPLRVADRSCTSDGRYCVPLPFYFFACPPSLHSLQMAWWAFFIPARLVWKPCCWKNSQWNMWWGWFSLALIVTENDGKIWAISRKGKGALSLPRASGEGMWRCLVLPCMKYHLKEAWGSFEPSPYWMSLPQANLWIMKLLGKGRRASLFLPRSLVMRGATLKVQWSRMAVPWCEGWVLSVYGDVVWGRGQGMAWESTIWILLRTVTHQPFDLM